MTSVQKAADRLDELSKEIETVSGRALMDGKRDAAESMALDAYVMRLGAAALRESEWLDIAGAPLDGTPVDLWTHNGRYADATFTDGRWVFQGINDWGTYGNVPVVYAPTHYRPLPSPPKEQGNG